MTVQRIGFNGNRLRALSYFLCFWCQTCVFLISKMKKRVQETWQALGRSWIQDWKRCTKCSLRMLNFLPSFGALATDCNTCQTDQLVGKGIGKWNKLKTAISTWLANVKMHALFSKTAPYSKHFFCKYNAEDAILWVKAQALWLVNLRWNQNTINQIWGGN